MLTVIFMLVIVFIALPNGWEFVVIFDITILDSKSSMSSKGKGKGKGKGMKIDGDMLKKFSNQHEGALDSTYYV